jgi:uncharacterized membrane protein YhaH (DUF805 family)
MVLPAGSEDVRESHLPIEGIAADLDGTWAKLTTTEVLFGFKGRVNRPTWWLWSLVNAFAVYFGLTTGLFTMLQSVFVGDEATVMESIVIATFGFVVFLASLVYGVWTALALGCKRLHDQDKSGWLQLLGAIPVLGGLALLVILGCVASTEGPNRFAPQPGTLLL